MLDYFAVFICPFLFFMGLALAPNGIWKIGQKLKCNEQIKMLVQQTQKEELEKISNNFLKNTTDDGSYKLLKIKASIDYAIGRHDWYETQRANIFRNILTVSGLVFAVLGLFARIDAPLCKLEQLIVLSVGITILLAVLAVLYFYNSELDQDRPYRLVSDIRHWYFRYSLPDRAVHLKQHSDLVKLASDVISERSSYLDRIIENAPIENSVREDIEQLFILHVLQRYKHESLQKMRWLLNYFMAALFIEGMWYYTYIFII